jgi:hypothetical protein
MSVVSADAAARLYRTTVGVAAAELAAFASGADPKKRIREGKPSAYRISHIWERTTTHSQE